MSAPDETQLRNELVMIVFLIVSALEMTAPSRTPLQPVDQISFIIEAEVLCKLTKIFAHSIAVSVQVSFKLFQSS
jgi:hypothetical protein